MPKYFVYSDSKTYDGPFDTAEDAILFLRDMASAENAPPERQHMVVTVLRGDTMDLYRDENGGIINGAKFM